MNANLHRSIFHVAEASKINGLVLYGAGLFFLDTTICTKGAKRRIGTTACTIGHFSTQDVESTTMNGKLIYFPALTSEGIKYIIGQDETRQKIVPADFKLCGLIEELIEQFKGEYGAYDVYAFVKEFFNHYIKNAQKTIAYYDYIKPKKGGEC